MARINKLHLFRLAPTAADRRPIRVGNNRTIETGHTVSAYRYLTCMLHDHPIVSIEETGAGAAVTLAACGYRTPTTRAAMQDFLRAAGIPGGISFAKGQFTARIFGRDLTATGPHGSAIIAHLTEAELAATRLYDGVTAYA